MIGFALVISMGACVKNRNANATDFSQITPILEIRDNISGIGNDAGLSNFGKASLSFTSDTGTFSFYVNLASEFTLDHDITVTVGIDNAALQSYNADPANAVDYELMPDSIFSLPATQVTIKAHERVALVSVDVYANKIDPSKSYMLPISITDASGINISGNFGTIYYHVIGNCLAGTYDVVGTRTNYTGAVSGGIISSVTDLSANSPKIVIPVDPTHTLVDYANLGGSGWAYSLTYDCAAGGNLVAVGNDVALASALAGTFSITTATYDPELKQIYLLSTYTNTSGNARVVEEWLTKE